MLKPWNNHLFRLEKNTLTQYLYTKIFCLDILQKPRWEPLKSWNKPHKLQTTNSKTSITIHQKVEIAPIHDKTRSCRALKNPDRRAFRQIRSSHAQIEICMYKHGTQRKAFVMDGLHVLSAMNRSLYSDIWSQAKSSVPSGVEKIEHEKDGTMRTSKQWL